MKTPNQLKLREFFALSRRLLRRLCLVCAALLLAPLLTLAQTDKQAWAQRFGTTFGSAELAQAVTRVLALP